jgi:hypothetical protein
MILRAWPAFGILIALASCLNSSAKPPEVLARPAIDGTATPALMQEYFQADPAKYKGATAPLHREFTPDRPGLPIADVALVLIIKCFQIGTSGGY